MLVLLILTWRSKRHVALETHNGVYGQEAQLAYSTVSLDH